MGAMTTRRDTYDCIVVGLGVMGNASAWALAHRGMRVLGLEQFEPGHTRGSSHGESRIMRQLYFEHPLYVPILQRAYALWEELEAESDSALLHLDGGLTLGPATGRVVPGALEAAKLHHLPYEQLSAEMVCRRFPAMHPPADYVGLWDPRAGYVRADRAIDAFRSVAERNGAELHYREEVSTWRIEGSGVVVETPRERYRAARLVLCAGAWNPSEVPGLHLPLEVERQVLVWFDPPTTPDLFDSAHFPIFVYEHRPGHTAYGFPRVDGRVKAAIFHGGETVQDPDVLQPPATEAEIRSVRDTLAPTFPAFATAPLRATATCLFTNAPDSRFVIGPHPTCPQVILCSACSGHGFKFAPAIGEIIADLALSGSSTLDISPFDVTRFAAGP